MTFSSIVLSHFQAAALLEGRETESRLEITPDLGLTTCVVKLSDRVIFPQGEWLAWETILEIAENENNCFLIENGELKSGLKNMRFTDSMMRAFGTVKGISKERERKESWWSAVGCMTVPAMHLKSFKFSGKTEF